jgi:transglutaminase/protease-like cytokinesis protein 3
LRAAKAGSGTIAYSFTDEADRLRKEQQFREKYAQKTLRSGKGICQDYSALFHTLCDLTGLQCIDIVGT